MSKEAIQLDKVQLVIANINLCPKLREPLDEFSQWYSCQAEDWEDNFCDSLFGTWVGTLYEFLTDNNIGIRSFGFEFYQIEEGSGSTTESQQND